MNPVEMLFLGKQLQKAGFKVHYFYYQSVLKTPAENALVLHKKITSLNLPDLHIVAHSLGGLIVMHLFDQFNDMPNGKIVMLGSPVNGSFIAKKTQNWPIISKLLQRSMPKALSGEDIPDWNTERDWGMIAGEKNYGLGFLTGGLPGPSDGTVLIEETHHPKQKDHILVQTSHTGLLFSKKVAKFTASFLNKGKF